MRIPHIVRIGALVIAAGHRKPELPSGGRHELPESFRLDLRRRVRVEL